KDIKSDRVFLIRGIEQNNIADPLPWHDAQDAIYQVTVWIEDGEARASLNVRANEVEKQSALTRAACTNKMHVTDSLFRHQRNGCPDPSMLVFPQKHTLRIDSDFRCRFGLTALPTKSRQANLGRRDVDEAG